MTPKELDAFIAAQERMSARIAKKAARGRRIARAYVHIKDGHGQSLGDRIARAIDRPGVAPTTRPKGKDGAQTFHFDLTTVNRTSKYQEASLGNQAGRSSAHSGYIEREGAAEGLDDELAIEARKHTTEGWLALGGQAYIERPGAVETVDNGRTLASFGNIAERFEDRVSFWDEVEKAASQPRSNGLVINLGNDPDFWSRLEEDGNAPAALRKAFLFARLKTDRSVGQSVREDAQPEGDSTTADKAPRKTRGGKGVMRISHEQAVEVHRYLKKHLTIRGGKKNELACHIEPGRGGRIQSRLIVELPHELQPEARLKLARDFCRHKFVEGRTAPLPHWCVIHAPDHHNDPRNTHMHIVFSERPARQIADPDTGEVAWDFAIQKVKVDKSYHKTLVRPYEQATDRSVNHRDWVKTARHDFSKLANAALEAAGASKRLDSRTYKDMGVDVLEIGRAPIKDYAKEKRGIATESAWPVIKQQWTREKDRLEGIHGDIRPNPDVEAAFDREISRLGKLGANVARQQLQIFKHTYREASVLRQHHSAEAAANAHILQRIHSRLIPPLIGESPPEKLVLDFSKMFAKDLITDNRLLAEAHAKGEEKCVRALKRAQAIKTVVGTEMIHLGDTSLTAQATEAGRSLLSRFNGSWKDVAAALTSDTRAAREARRAQEGAVRAQRIAAAEEAIALKLKEAAEHMRQSPVVASGTTHQEAGGARNSVPVANGLNAPPPIATIDAADALQHASAYIRAAEKHEVGTVQAFLGRTGPVIQQRVVPFSKRVQSSEPTSGTQAPPGRAATARPGTEIRMPKPASIDYAYDAPLEPRLASEVAAAEAAQRRESEKLAAIIADQKASILAKQAEIRNTTMPLEVAKGASKPKSPPTPTSSATSVLSAAPAQSAGPQASTEPVRLKLSSPSPMKQMVAAFGASPKVRTEPTARPPSTDAPEHSASPSPIEKSTPTPTPNAATPMPLPSPAASPAGGSNERMGPGPAKKKKRELTREEIRRRALLARSRGNDIGR